MFLPQILNPLINNIQVDSQSWTTLFLIPVILVASMPSPASFFHQPTLAEPAQPARGVGTDFPCSLPSGYSELPSPLTCQELAQAHSLCEFQLSLGPHCSLGFPPIQSEVGYSCWFPRTLLSWPQRLFVSLYSSPTILRSVRKGVLCIILQI